MKENLNEFESFDVRKTVRFLLKHWKWVALGVTVSCFIGFLYVRYSTPEYQASAKVLIKNNENNAISSSELEGLGFLNEGVGAESEAEILKSRQLLGQVVKELDLTTIAHVYGGFTKIKKSELDKSECPVWISLIDTTDDYFAPISIKTEAAAAPYFTLIFEKGENLSVKSGDTIQKNGRKLRFDVVPENMNNSKSFEFKIISRDEAVTDLINRVAIDREQINEGILNISTTGPSPVKNNLIIDELIHQQQQSAIDQKNLTAIKTNNFLSNRLALIEQKLDSIEDLGRSLKTANGIIDVPSELPALLSEERQLEEELFELTFNESIAAQMVDFLDSDQDLQSLIPVSLSFQSNSLNIAISEYNQLVLERNRLLASSNENNPAVVKRRSDIIRLRGNLKKSVGSYASSIKAQKQRVVSKLSTSASKKSSIPKYELDYRDAMRDQKISESIYLLLLQKKEENEILLASTESNIRVIDYAYSQIKPVSPNKKMVYMLAGILGALLPILFFYVRSLLDNKLSGREEIQKLGLPVIGEIPLSKDQLLETLKEDSRNPTSEAFITIRTNIGFMLDKKSANVIMVTSSVAGEGKTYASINLAKSFTASGKKTVVLGLDLRAPKLLECIEVPYTIGVSNFLSSTDVKLESIIYQTPVIAGLDFIPCGTIPPNPSELLLRDRFTELMEKLKENYDVIVIDTSPIGLVADTLSIAEFADLLIYVARVGHVKSEIMKLPQSLYNDNKFKSLTVLMNGVERSNSGYGYGYGQASSGSKRGILNLIRSKRK